jgi:hypothetical protein
MPSCCYSKYLRVDNTCFLAHIYGQRVCLGGNTRPSTFTANYPKKDSVFSLSPPASTLTPHRQSGLRSPTAACLGGGERSIRSTGGTSTTSSYLVVPTQLFANACAVNMYDSLQLSLCALQPRSRTIENARAVGLAFPTVQNSTPGECVCACVCVCTGDVPLY